MVVRNCPSTLNGGSEARLGLEGSCSGVAFKTKLDRLGNFVETASQVPTLHTANGTDRLDVGMLPLGNLNEQVVAQDTPGGACRGVGLPVHANATVP